MPEPLQGPACWGSGSGRGCNRLALRDQFCGRGQKPRALHLPGQLVEHTAGIHGKARHLRHGGLDRQARQGPIARHKSMRIRPGAGGDRISKRRFQPEAESFRVDRHHHIAIRRHRILDRGERIAAIAQQFGAQQWLLCPQRSAGKGHLHVAANRRCAISCLERSRHQRPRPLCACHIISFVW